MRTPVTDYLSAFVGTCEFSRKILSAKDASPQATVKTGEAVFARFRNGLGTYLGIYAGFLCTVPWFTKATREYNIAKGTLPGKRATPTERDSAVHALWKATLEHLRIWQ
jgi:hypothetical protein